MKTNINSLRADLSTILEELHKGREEAGRTFDSFMPPTADELKVAAGKLMVIEFTRSVVGQLSDILENSGTDAAERFISFQVMQLKPAAVRNPDELTSLAVSQTHAVLNKLHQLHFSA